MVSIKTAAGSKIVAEIVADKSTMDAAAPSGSGKNRTLAYSRQTVVVNGVPVTVQVTCYIPNKG